MRFPEDITTVQEPGMIVSMEPGIVVFMEKMNRKFSHWRSRRVQRHDIMFVNEYGNENISKFPFAPEHIIPSETEYIHTPSEVYL